jgi:hypothetical protein
MFVVLYQYVISYVEFQSFVIEAKEQKRNFRTATVLLLYILQKQYRNISWF